MKKRLMTLSMCLILLMGFIMNSSAMGVISDRTIEYFDDGSYAVTEIREIDNITTRSSITTKVVAKDYHLYDGDGAVIFTFTVTGTFEVNYGVSAKCTKATPSTKINDSAWRLISQSAWPSGNQAIATATFKRYMLGIPVRTETPTVTLTCDKYGNFT